MKGAEGGREGHLILHSLPGGQHGPRALPIIESDAHAKNPALQPISLRVILLRLGSRPPSDQPLNRRCIKVWRGFAVQLVRGRPPRFAARATPRPFAQRHASSILFALESLHFAAKLCNLCTLLGYHVSHSLVPFRDAAGHERRTRGTCTVS